MLSQRRRRAKVWYPPNEWGGRCSDWKTKKMLTKKRCEIYLTQCKVIEAGREECARKEITPPPPKKGRLSQHYLTTQKLVSSEKNIHLP